MTCRECGLVHPAVTEGECPIAADANIKSSLEVKDKLELSKSIIQIKNALEQKSNEIGKDEIKIIVGTILKMIDEMFS